VILIAAEEGDHLSVSAADGRFDGGPAGEEGLVGVGLGAGVDGGALRHAELCGAGFDAGGVLLDEALEVFSGAAQLGMAEG